VNAVVRLAAVMAVVVILVGAWMFFTAGFEHDDLPRGFTSPVLAMQMARSMQEVEMIVGEPGHSDRSEMRDQQYMDFAFIAAYWLEFSLISVLLGRRSFRFAKALGLCAGLCATLAALLDVRENLAILKVLSASPTPENDPLVHAVRHAAVPKWALLFVAMILLSFVFLGRRDWRLMSGLPFLGTGLLFMLTGSIGLIGLTTSEAAVELIQIPMLGGLIILLIALWLAPSKLLEGI
jgi:hypothetical protein